MADPGATYYEMQAGTKARVYGLIKAPEYNGKAGEMVGLDPETGRYWIQFDEGGERLKLKRSNVMAIEHREEVGGAPPIGQGTIQGVLAKLVAINKRNACAILQSHSGRKFQAFQPPSSAPLSPCLLTTQLSTCDSTRVTANCPPEPARELQS